MDSSTAQECGEEQEAIRILASGSLGRLMAMEFTPGLMETGTKESSSHVWNMERALRSLQMGIVILELMLMVSLAAMANTLGQMAVFLRVTLRMVWDTVTEYGKKVLESQINMKDSTQMIGNLGMGFFLGQQEIYTKGIISTMWDTVTEKCIGAMVATIKGNGKKVFSMDKVVFY